MGIFRIPMTINLITYMAHFLNFSNNFGKKYKFPCTKIYYKFYIFKHEKNKFDRTIQFGHLLTLNGRACNQC